MTGELSEKSPRLCYAGIESAESERVVLVPAGGPVIGPASAILAAALRPRG